jgi:hypothetical protein
MQSFVCELILIPKDILWEISKWIDMYSLLKLKMCSKHFNNAFSNLEYLKYRYLQTGNRCFGILCQGQYCEEFIQKEKQSLQYFQKYRKYTYCFHFKYQKLTNSGFIHWNCKINPDSHTIIPKFFYRLCNDSNYSHLCDFSKAAEKLIGQQVQDSENYFFSSYHSSLLINDCFGKWPKNYIVRINERIWNLDVIEQCKDHLCMDNPHYELFISVEPNQIFKNGKEQFYLPAWHNITKFCFATMAELEQHLAAWEIPNHDPRIKIVKVGNGIILENWRRTSCSAEYCTFYSQCINRCYNQYLQ